MIEFPYEIPEDFDEFWQIALDEALAKPLKVSSFRIVETENETHVVEVFSFGGIDDTVRHGWIAYPPGARDLPAFLWVPPYGRESKLPDQYGTRTGMVSLSFNFHGEDAFHQEEYVPERGYFAQGAEEPGTWIFRRMFQDCIIALRILAASTQANPDGIGVAGMSQGGGMSVWLGAWAPMVKAVCADMPFMCAMGHTVLNAAYRYPTKELANFMDEVILGKERLLNTLSYFDTVFHAERCSIPTHVSVGLRDPSCRPANVQLAIDSLPGKKHVEILDWGHDYHESMVLNNKRWFFQNL